jgi:two-component system sensor histidine kinase DegS
MVEQIVSRGRINVNNDESKLDTDKIGPEQLEKLDVVLSQLVNALQQGRNNIFDIAEDCQNQCLILEREAQKAKQEVQDTIELVEKTEKLEKLARLRLVEVSSNFRSFSENDIKQAYTVAQSLQIQLANLRQKELYACKQRDEVLRQLKQFKDISKKADTFLNNTGSALNILQGNVQKISESVEQAFRKQQMGMWIIQSQESERRRIARDLHDGPAQGIASMLIRLDLVGQLAPNDQQRTFQELASIKEMGRETLTDVRRIMFELKPTLVNDSGLVTTLKEFFNDYEAKYNFDIDFVVFGAEKKYDLTLEIALFRLVQEALTNVRKHAAVKKALVKLEHRGDMLTLVVKDNGLGFDPEAIEMAAGESYGIIGMKERVELLGGEIDILSAPGAGTQVIIKVPVEGEDKL